MKMLSGFNRVSSIFLEQYEAVAQNELFLPSILFSFQLREVVERYHPLLLVARKGGRISKEVFIDH